METLDRKCRRLFNCLDELIRQEAACLRRNDPWGLAELQERSAPLITFLAESGSEGADEVFRRRITAVIAHRQATAKFFAAQAADLRQRIAELDGVRHRVSRLLPAYRESAAAGVRFAAVG